jgi:hypothetical protein
MTKAERIFKETRWECRRHINTWGFEEIGFNAVATKDNESVSTRTLNDLDKVYNKAVKSLMTDYKLGVIDKEKATKEAQILKMVRLTIDNERKNLAN